MRTRNIVAVGAVTSALLLAGCAGGATIKTTIGPGSPLCTDLATFATQNAVLNDAAAESRANLLQVLPQIHALVVKMQNEAPTGDTINAKPLKADLGTVAGVYADTITALQNASATDPAGVHNALLAVDAKEGQAATDAVGRLDAYANPVCKVSITSPSVTTSSTTTATSTSSTVGPVGPAVPTTTVAPTGATTTAAPTSPTT